MKEKRLIDANAMRDDWLENGENEYVYDTNAVLNSIDLQSTIDAVPVIRCRDCKHMIPQSHTRYCTVWHCANGMGDNGFCNYGERKEGNDNG